MSLTVQRIGSGPDLVLIHGWGLHSGVWAALLPILSRHYCLHLVDLPGHGNSSLSVAGSSWLQLLYDSTPEHAMWLGWSLGGLLTLQMAQQYEGKIDKAIVVACSPCFLQCADWTPAMTEQTLQKFIDDLRQDYVATVQRFLLLQIGSEQKSRATVRQLQDMVRQGPSPDPLALAQGLLMLRQQDMRPLLAQIKTPVLVVQGSRDRLVPSAAAEYLAAHLAHGHLAMIDKAGHAPFLSHTDLFLQLLQGFIAEEAGHAHAG
jgi:pimeloyl-[acyl-carrier protein] methyl ester esterase